MKIARSLKIWPLVVLYKQLAAMSALCFLLTYNLVKCECLSLSLRIYIHKQILAWWLCINCSTWTVYAQRRPWKWSMCRSVLQWLGCILWYCLWIYCQSGQTIPEVLSTPCWDICWTIPHCHVRNHKIECEEDSHLLIWMMSVTSMVKPQSNHRQNRINSVLKLLRWMLVIVKI